MCVTLESFLSSTSQNKSHNKKGFYSRIALPDNYLPPNLSGEKSDPAEDKPSTWVILSLYFFAEIVSFSVCQGSFRI